MKIGSLFSGYGGLNLAALQLFPGSSVAWHCEWETAPSKILAHHWPTVPNYHDVKTLDWSQIPAIDVLTGGYPCQPFSAAGRRQGTNDERHLWPYVRHAIRALRPRFTLLENVAGHRSMGFDRVLGDCAEDGLHVRWTSLRASDVGACHRRERLFILITTPNTHSDAVRLESVTEPRGCSASEPRRVGADASDTEGDGWSRIDDGRGLESTRSGWDGKSRRSARSAPLPLTLLPTPRVTTGGSLASSKQVDRIMAGEITEHADARLELTAEVIARRNHALLPTPRTSDANGPGVHRDGGIDLRTAVTLDWGPYEAAIHRQERLSRLAPSPTQLSRNGKPRLDPPFPEWMMFLPEGHVTDSAIGLSRNDQLKAIGNGVCPPQAVAAYRPMLRAVAA